MPKMSQWPVFVTGLCVIGTSSTIVLFKVNAGSFSNGTLIDMIVVGRIYSTRIASPLGRIDPDYHFQHILTTAVRKDRQGERPTVFIPVNNIIGGGLLRGGGFWNGMKEIKILLMIGCAK